MRALCEEKEGPLLRCAAAAAAGKALLPSKFFCNISSASREAFCAFACSWQFCECFPRSVSRSSIEALSAGSLPLRPVSRTPPDQSPHSIP